MTNQPNLRPIGYEAVICAVHGAPYNFRKLLLRSNHAELCEIVTALMELHDTTNRWVAEEGRFEVLDAKRRQPADMDSERIAAGDKLADAVFQGGPEMADVAQKLFDEWMNEDTAMSAPVRFLLRFGTESSIEAMRGDQFPEDTTRRAYRYSVGLGDFDMAELRFIATGLYVAVAKTCDSLSLMERAYGAMAIGSHRDGLVERLEQAQAIDEGIDSSFVMASYWNEFPLELTAEMHAAATRLETIQKEAVGSRMDEVDEILAKHGAPCPGCGQIHGRPEAVPPTNSPELDAAFADLIEGFNQL